MRKRPRRPRAKRPYCGRFPCSLGFASSKTTRQGQPAMIDLYCLTSPNVQKIFIMLEELGLDYKMIPVDVWKGDQYNPDFIKISPNSKIPVIVDQDGPG